METKQAGGRRGWLALGVVVLLGLTLRLYRVDWQSVWHDEICTLYACGQSLAEMTSIVVADYNNPPLHYCFLYGWFELFGYGPLQGRLMSVAFGTLAVLFTGLLARELFGERVGILAGLLMAVSTLGVMFSHEARCYSQLLGFTVAASYFFARAVREPTIGRWLAFVLCAVGSAYTHYYGLLTVLVLVGFALVFHREFRIPLKWWVGGLTLSLLLFTPWIYSGAVELMLEGRKFVVEGDQPSLQVKWFSLLSTVNWFNNGKWFGVHASTPVWLAGLGGLLFSLPAAWGSREVLGIRGGKDEASRARWLLLVNSLWLVPLMLIVAASMVGAVKFNFRYIAYLAAPYSLVVAKGISDIKPGVLRYVWLGLVLMHSAIGLRAVYYLPYKDDYRAAVNLVAEQHQPGDCSVFLPFQTWGQVPKFWYVYRPDQQPPDLRTAEQAAADSGCNRVWLVWDRTWWINRNTEPTEQAIATVERTHDIVQRRQFFNSEVRLYVPKPPLSH